MIKNESNELMKTMLKCGLQLLMVASGIGLIVGIVKLCINYSANIGNFIFSINNLFLPSKHFIQNNIWIFLTVWVFVLLWLVCVFVKTPPRNVKSYRLLTKILGFVLSIGTVLMLCIADMPVVRENEFSGLLFFTSFLFIVISGAVIYGLIDFIADQHLKITKETN